MIAHEEFRPLTHVEVPGLSDGAVRRQPVHNKRVVGNQMYESGEASGTLPSYGIHWNLVVEKMRPQAHSKLSRKAKSNMSFGELVTTDRWRRQR